MNYEDVGKRPINETAKPLFEILQGGDSTVDLEAEEYWKYISLRLTNIIKTYDPETGDETKVNLHYPVIRCSEENFKDSSFAQKYWKQVKDGRV